MAEQTKYEAWQDMMDFDMWMVLESNSFDDRYHNMAALMWVAGKVRR